jgi:hypothetical protein
MSVYLHLDSLARESPYICNCTYSVQFATTSALPLSTLTLNILTANQNGQLTIDGVLVPQHSIILVKDQIIPSENGIYKVTQTGSSTQPWILTRYILTNGTVLNVPLDPISLSICVNTPEIYKALTSNHNRKFTIDFGSPAAPITIGTTPFTVVLGCKWRPNDPRLLLHLVSNWNVVVATGTGENLAGYGGGGSTISLISPSVNGVTLNPGDLVLVKDQIIPVQNGVYVYSAFNILTRVVGLAVGDSFAIGQFTIFDIYTATYYTITSSGIVNTNPIIFNINLGLLSTNGIINNNVQMATNYKVYFEDLNCPNNKRTIGFRAHCKDTPENLTYSVEFCTVILPSITLRQNPIYDNNNNIIAFDYSSILNEPYIYVRLRSIDHALDDVITTNNPPAEEATFVVWHDKYNLGSDTVINPDDDPIIFPSLTAEPRWIVFKSCMMTTMRLNLRAESLEVRIFDRFGRDLILLEDATIITPANPPPVNPYKQTMMVVGIRPNYPV